MSEGAPFDLEAMRARLATEEGPRLWRSLEELAELPEVRRYVEAEFPDIVQAATIDRRTLLRLMSASLALGGLAACDSSDAIRNAPLLSQSHAMPGYTARRAAHRGHVPAAERLWPRRPREDAGGAADQDRGQSASSRKPWCDGRLRPGRDPVALRSRPVRCTASEWRAAQLAGADGLHPPRAQRTRRRRGKGAAHPDAADLFADPAQARRHRRGSSFRMRRWHSFSPIDDDNRRARRHGRFRARGRSRLRSDPGRRHRDPRRRSLCRGSGSSPLRGRSIRRAGGCRSASFRASLPSKTRPSLVGARADERIPLRPRDFEAFAQALAAALETGSAPPGSHPSIPRLADELRRAGSRSLVAAGREQPAARSCARASRSMRGSAPSARPSAPSSPCGRSPARSGRSRIWRRRIAAGQVSRLVILGGNPGLHGAGGYRSCRPHPPRSAVAASRPASRRDGVPSATGMFRRAIRSKAGAICAPSTARSGCASRRRCR